MPTKIPKYVQVLNQDTPPDDLKDRLIKTHDLDGIILDKEMLKANPRAKQQTISITNTPKKAKVHTSGSVDYSGGQNEKMDSWTYCGYFWYVRKPNEEHEFARYLAYNTKTKKTEGPWDHTIYASKNK